MRPPPEFGHSASLSRMQSFLLQGLLPIVVVGTLLPLGLVAMLLSLKEASPSDAVSHGELYLAGGNAAFMGCVSLTASRHDKGLNAAICALFTVVVVVLPCYAAWAYMSVQTITNDTFSRSIAVDGGYVVAGLGTLIAIIFVLFSYPATTESPQSGLRQVE